MFKSYPIFEMFWAKKRFLCCDIDGVELSEKVNERLNEEAILKIFFQVLNGLQYLLNLQYHLFNV